MFDSSIITLTAGEALAANRRVRLSSGTAVYADAGERCIGVTQAGAANGDPVAVKLWAQSGTVEVEATGAITAGTAIYGTADGKIDDAVAGGPQIGVAKTAASGAGGLVEVVPYAGGQNDLVFVPLPHQVPGAALTRIVADRALFLLSANKRIDVIGSDAGAVTSKLWKAPSGTAPASGTDQHASGSFNLKGTANTNQAATLSATPADRTYAAGDSLVEVFTGTTTAAIGGGTAVFAVL